ncbi:MAG: RNA polymerase sigma factor SigW [Candidatus Magasanikbacteria bacterium CG_4_9_14_0_2_um_filter_42_11]|uniref:RNA polymerase sigma factor SigW n=1 Tax=Candidatus Magasanikbacteria bacterium CG_4_9_14_0_2_um_filter_42_11 TaxID=1974643 RepID=A0A2M8FAM6_9BACT|nr:MAG: RNA polymerase sigma factor SigW [Candidatus Magasanikbacteria bacterium CG10_big_fil_rev_8_21_14_0_10_43_9]PIY92078.1 MAG: RNA polymerase sigma factor SigW [Candidatus Magasanikbacteria bacterium CG_4_10_14_0_8_um_filter_42_12]PJC52794.1 MAG: RNA polymerase sigma factor SigW [Candidatus Magasanikbacteria bacterium CG_4_9_14_0_2_um_filter_42_11]
MTDYSDQTDESLALLSATDHDAFGALVGRYEQKLYRYIRRITDASHEECEDILQETFLKAYRYVHNFDPLLSFSSWIYRIAHNETISHFRKRSVRPQTIKEEDGTLYLQNITADINIVDDIDREALQQQLQEVLSSLGPKYKDVLILRYLEEKSYQEISDILKMPIKTVGTRINRAKKQLQEIVKTSNIILTP